MFNFKNTKGEETPEGEKCAGCGRIATLFATDRQSLTSPLVYHYTCHACGTTWTRTAGNAHGVNPSNLPDNWVGGDLFGMIEKGKEKGKEGGKK